MVHREHMLVLGSFTPKPELQIETHVLFYKNLLATFYLQELQILKF